MRGQSTGLNCGDGTGGRIGADRIAGVGLEGSDWEGRTRRSNGVGLGPSRFKRE